MGEYIYLMLMLDKITKNDLNIKQCRLPDTIQF